MTICDVCGKDYSTNSHELGCYWRPFVICGECYFKDYAVPEAESSHVFRMPNNLKTAVYRMKEKYKRYREALQAIAALKASRDGRQTVPPSQYCDLFYAAQDIAEQALEK